MPETAIDREEKMSFDNFSRGDTMMRRRIEHTGMKVGVRIGPDGIT